MLFAGDVVFGRDVFAGDAHVVVVVESQRPRESWNRRSVALPIEIALAGLGQEDGELLDHLHDHGNLLDGAVFCLYRLCGERHRFEARSRKPC